jgi:ABC-type branched-subunit amino acid transport system substrate-binding protein
MKILYLFLLCFWAGPAHSQIRLAVMGYFPEGKGLETRSAQIAVDAANTRNASKNIPVYQLVVYNDHNNPDEALKTAQRLIKDRQIMGVVVHGENSVHPAVLDEFKNAGLAVVSASSWAAERPLKSAVTWMCPTQKQMAKLAAVYAHQEKNLTQVAVVDNGSTTSQAAAQAFEDRFKQSGGKIAYSGTWDGSESSLTRTVRVLKANWPQAVFFAGEGAEAGRLIKLMKKERELQSALLIGLPSFFDEGFFNEGRLDTIRSTALFPAPDYRGQRILLNQTGVSFKRNSPNWKAYYGYAWKRPGRWTSLSFDAMRLLTRAVDMVALGQTNSEDDPDSGVDESAVVETGRDLDETSDDTALVEESSSSSVQISGVDRQSVKNALLSIESNKGIQGLVNFDEQRWPAQPKVMIYLAIPRTNTNYMTWREYKYGPPFR